MTKYIVKPELTEIEAVQLLWENWSTVCELAGVGRLADGTPEGCYIGDDGQPTGDSTDVIGLLVPDGDGFIVAREGDWIVRGVTGHVFVCPPGQFEQAYIAVPRPNGYVPCTEP